MQLLYGGNDTRYGILSVAIRWHSLCRPSYQHQNNFQIARKGYTLKVPEKFFQLLM